MQWEVENEAILGHRFDYCGRVGSFSDSFSHPRIHHSDHRNAHAGPSDFGFSFSGPSLSLFSSTSDFVPGDQSGNKIPASFNEDGVFPNESGGTVDGVTADILVGVLTVSPSYGPGQIPSQPATAS